MSLLRSTELSRWRRLVRPVQRPTASTAGVLKGSPKSCNLYRQILCGLQATCFAVLCLATLTVNAQEPVKGITYSELSKMDNSYMDQQRTLIDDMARLQLGAQLRGTTDDLDTLQRIIYRGLIKKDERTKLQALGVVLGDIFVKELGLSWTIFEDKYGRTRAACIPKTEHCLFPITMLSRRMEVGLLPDVRKIYEENAEGIRALQPKNPFDASSHVKK